MSGIRGEDEEQPASSSARNVNSLSQGDDLAQQHTE